MKEINAAKKRILDLSWMGRLAKIKESNELIEKGRQLQSQAKIALANIDTEKHRREKDGVLSYYWDIDDMLFHERYRQMQYDGDFLVTKGEKIFIDAEIEFLELLKSIKSDIRMTWCFGDCFLETGDTFLHKIAS
ncbi:MAG: hypothetical protein ABSB91_00365 [Sedimentisphaerales bacterium]|jgi:hypothetical protein